MTLKRQHPGGGPLLVALEQAWAAIAEQHPDLPPAHIVTGQGSGRGGLLLGHLAPERWEPADGRGELVHELLIAGEGLSRGAVDVFTTQLHEAAHALALARGITDTSRDGRYHNKRYQQLARELGLDAARDPSSGWSQTTLPAETQARYQPVIDAIECAITLHRLREPVPAATARNLAPAVCGCPRRIRVAPSVLEAGEITCQVCRQPFITPPADDKYPDRGTHDTATPSARRARTRRDPADRENAATARGAPAPTRGRSLHVPRNWPARQGAPLTATPRLPRQRTSSHERTAEQPNPKPRSSPRMATQNLNHVVITGNLTADPELRALPSGSSVCKLRVAVNTRRKDSSGEWLEKANYFDVTVWGAQGENAATYLSKGRPVGVQGRLEWREWETSDGAKRQAVEIIADQVQFLGSAPTSAEHPEADAEPAAAGELDPQPEAKTNGAGNRGSRRKRDPEPAAVGAAATTDDGNDSPF